jgi:cob(I)alamin adenosyltransferase
LSDKVRTKHPKGEEGKAMDTVTSTKKGDRGRTSLLSGERVSKSSQRIEVCGNLDETNAALGLARAFASHQKVLEIIGEIQKHLLLLGSELSSASPGMRLKRIEEDQIANLEQWIHDLQLEVPLSRGFVDPGQNPTSAALDMARAVARRAERSIVALQESGETTRQEVMSYFNRMGFLLFILARYADKMC